jgi:hypothetical protein
MIMELPRCVIIETCTCSTAGRLNRAYLRDL